MGDWDMTPLFVAVRPPPQVMARLAAIDRPALPGVRCAAPEQWLIKLRPLGYVDGRVVAPLRDALAAELAGRPVAGSWTARSVSLLADRSSPGAVRFHRRLLGGRVTAAQYARSVRRPHGGWP
jgi:hypothetical protein